MKKPTKAEVTEYTEWVMAAAVREGLFTAHVWEDGRIRWMKTAKYTDERLAECLERARAEHDASRLVTGGL